VSRRSVGAAIAFLTPNLLGLALFTALPIVLSAYMAFTNWSLKPAVSLEFVGLRNFADLLGVRQVEGAGAAVGWSYGLSAAAVLAGLVTALWANFSNWRGLKLSGAVFLAIGVSLLVSVFGGYAGAGTFLAGLAIGIAGLGTMRREDASWSLGRGLIPGVLLGVGIAGLAGLSGAMWGAYELRDARFWQYLYNTLFLMSTIPLGIAGSLVLATLLNDPLPARSRKRRAIVAVVLAGVGCLVCWMLYRIAGSAAEGGAVMGLTAAMLKNGAFLMLVFWLVAALAVAFNVVAFRTLFYLPTFTAGVAMMILWKALYNPQNGPIDAMIELVFGRLGPLAEQIGLSGLAGWMEQNASPKWLGDKRLAKPALMMMGLWISMGGTNMLLYLAGLSNVPRDLLEAAEVDGAGRWARFRHVTWPQLAPTTFFISVMSVIAGLQGGFEQARVMTNGGPEGSTTTLSFYIYNKAFVDLDLGYAAAIAWVLFAIIFVVTAMNWKFGKGTEVDL